MWQNVTSTSYIVDGKLLQVCYEFSCSSPTGYTITNSSFLPTTMSTTVSLSTNQSSILYNATTTQSVTEAVTDTVLVSVTTTTTDFIPTTVTLTYSEATSYYSTYTVTAQDISAQQKFVKPRSCTCASPISTSTIVTIKTIDAVATTSLTIIQTPIVTPSPNMTTFVDVVTTSAVSEIDVYYISTTVVLTQTNIVTFTAIVFETETDLAFTTSTALASSTISSTEIDTLTTTRYTATITLLPALPLATVVCPQSNGADYAYGNTYRIQCGVNYPQIKWFMGSDVDTLEDCIQKCSWHEPCDIATFDRNEGSCWLRTVTANGTAPDVQDSGFDSAIVLAHA